MVQTRRQNTTKVSRFLVKISKILKILLKDKTIWYLGLRL
jgi:hypothetical protein